ncbi:hypothetical protein [Photobacterium indicum]|uniref:Secreted protein n=1 Tax=Photobacterium indicum TaxID=81447 RepID=A0A2T3L5A6_9GAMM|nr:hypothetical protein [Photobacterium indicum]PSV44863.1 hypothetical protein C9J47_19475 [Photobacterium indicum]
MKKLLTLSAIIISFTASAGGTLGGNVPADSGAVNTSVGVCVTYRAAIKKAQAEGKDIKAIAKPKDVNCDK